jgi:ribosomal 30S subunit maturation factor RimM
LIPVVPEFIYSVDATASIVTISPVEGLLDWNKK